MHWVIQSNFVADQDMQRLLHALERLDVSYSLVKLLPIVHKLESTPQIEGPVFVYGTPFAYKGAFNSNWLPGYMGGNATYEDLLNGFGSEMLNSQVEYQKLKDVVIPNHQDIFIRPANDGKLFTGQVVNTQEWEKLKSHVLGYFGDKASDEILVLAEPQKILAEYRCLVVNGEVIAASSYRRGGKVFCSDQVDQSVLDYAQTQVNRYQPDLGFALDVAQTHEGFKIIEVNALSSCGFYQCDILKLADALNQLDSLYPSLQANSLKNKRFSI